MNKTSSLTALKICRLGLIIGVYSTAVAVSGQSQARRNNPYAPSPAGNARPAPATTSKNSSFVDVASIRNRGPEKKSEDRPALFEPVVIYTKKEPGLAPTDIYRVGIDDVLNIRLQNASSSSAYCTVRADGTIDFPLAGEAIPVVGLTVEEIKSVLATSIKLFAEPKVDVNIREYASHKVTVLGSVRDPGEKKLRREAVPLFAIKSEAVIDPASTGVKISENGSREPKTYYLRDPLTDNILIYPGNTVEFFVEKARAASYFVTGNRVTSGELPLTVGLTLLKVAVSANTSGSEPKKAIIQRKDKDGKPGNLEFNLKAIKSGKIADPTIEAGDIIDIRN